MRDALRSVLLSEDEIRKRVGELAAQISSDYSFVDELLLVGVLRGAFIFLADLSRCLTIPRRVDFVALSTYAGEATKPGEVRLVLDLRAEVRGAHVLIVEDIVDTGRTLAFLLNLLRARGPASLRSCVLVRKPARLEVDVPIEYLGFDIPDVWAAGYGLDWADQYRTLPYIAVVEPG